MVRRVAITGLGCVTPLGADVDSVWKRLLAGESGVGELTVFDAHTFPVRIAAEVRDWDLSAVGEDPHRWRKHARQTQFAIGAALLAQRNSCLSKQPVDPARVGVYLGCGEIFPDFFRFANSIGAVGGNDPFELSRFIELYSSVADSDDDVILEPGAAASASAGLLDAQGPVMNLTNACVSSSSAIGEAMDTIRRGDAEVMYAGGAHSMIHPFGITGFHRLSTLSLRNDEPTRASRPFDLDRDGFVVGEGAAILVLEEWEHAQQRGAEILAEVSGYATTHDAFRVTDPRPDGRSATRCMRQALDDAQLTGDEIDYINAHGSGTVANDKVETAAIKEAFGKRAQEIPISSTKSMTGHLTTACGALEVLICALVLRHGWAPPTINYETPDPDCDLDYIPNQAREIAARHVLNNNSGFGGQNVALVLSKAD